jgi:DNA-binding NarL/FixJ family response regulator
MEQSSVSAAAHTRVAVLADDLIWSSRLRAAASNAGAQPVPVKDAESIDAPFALIDLGGREYDGVEAVKKAASSGATVLAVCEHDDIGLRKLALGAGAKRVLSYNKMFGDGPGVITRLIEGTL